EFDRTEQRLRTPECKAELHDSVGRDLEILRWITGLDLLIHGVSLHADVVETQRCAAVLRLTTKSKLVGCSMEMLQTSSNPHLAATGIDVIPTALPCAGPRGSGRGPWLGGRA